MTTRMAEVMLKAAVEFAAEKDRFTTLHLVSRQMRDANFFITDGDMFDARAWVRDVLEMH